MPLVLLHGLLSAPQEFGLIALPLRGRNVNFITPRINGYGMADKPNRSSWRAWSAAASAAIADAVPEGRPLVLGGLCAGGLIAATLALQGRHDVRGLVLMSPTFDYDGWGQSRWKAWRKLGYALGLDRWIRVAERDPYGIKNPRIRAWVAREMKERSSSAAGPSTLPLWALHEVERMKDEVRARLPQLDIPTLVIHAREDEICSLASVNDAMQAIRAKDKKLVVLENSYHMITIDNDRQQVVAELVAFVNECGAAPAAHCPGRSQEPALDRPATELEAA
jgi:carboxylesterase